MHHTHTRTHTNTNTSAHSQKHTQKYLRTHSNQAPSPIHEFDDWIVKAKKLFAATNSGRAICEVDFKGKSCALSFSMLQTLAKP